MTTEAEKVPTAWFAMLEIARQKGDAEGERKALRKLQELGVLVAFTEPTGDTETSEGKGLSKN